MNIIVLLGRLVRDPEVRYTTTGKCVCQFTLAVDRPFTNQDGQREADFINIVVWGKTAELCGNSLMKGHRLGVVGRLQIRSYDGKDGKKHYITEVIANSVKFIERKEQPETAPQENAGFESFAAQEAQEKFNFDEEIPF